jgi:hypothetical protein|eukprot:COSAG06_NODE_323_length_17558_cov_36.451801_12_plen_70_part_00
MGRVALDSKGLAAVSQCRVVGSRQSGDLLSIMLFVLLIERGQLRLKLALLCEFSLLLWRRRVSAGYLCL